MRRKSAGPHLLSPERDGTPIFPDMVHWWLGRLLMLLGFVNVVLGCAVFHDASLTAFTPAVIVALLLGVIMLVYYAAGQVVFGSVHHDASSAGEEQPKASPQTWRAISFGVLALGVVLGIVSVIVAESSFVPSL